MHLQVHGAVQGRWGGMEGVVGLGGKVCCLHEPAASEKKPQKSLSGPHHPCRGDPDGNTAEALVHAPSWAQRRGGDQPARLAKPQSSNYDGCCGIGAHRLGST